MSKVKRNPAFSIVELMAVIAIVAIIAAALMPSYQSYTKKTNVTKIVSKFNTFQNAAVDEYLSTGNWPASINGTNANSTDVSTDFPFVESFTFNNSANKAWYGYKLNADHGSGWIYMLIIFNGGVFEVHCGAHDSGCTTGSCSSYEYYPSGCNEQDLGTTYSF